MGRHIQANAPDPDDESGKLGLVVMVMLVCLVATVKSCTELRYTLAGEVTRGEFTSIRRLYGDPKRPEKQFALYYQFEDSEGDVYKGRVVFGEEEARKRYRTRPEITYLPSSPKTHTLTSERSIVWPVIFAVTFIALCVLFYRQCREAHGQA